MCDCVLHLFWDGSLNNNVGFGFVSVAVDVFFEGGAFNIANAKKIA